ncbi:hypothetical protein [Lactococcus allomyrinae]|uniref:DUF4352 domain-containing protein n=1 Tax=Lactococcus allomyrinae TaxID=2419773 RepID=A0A387BJL4_9LACT|nr:hypothetical protein [Lactococcus allomyrinae]AYG01120.1 hypothetical protein D7I46_08455 [Lactococcus allomyrinae]
MRKKSFLIIFLVAIILVLSVIRIKKINSNVPHSFEIKTFEQNKWVSLDDLKLSVTGYKLGKSYHYDGGNPNDQYINMPVTINVTVTNISNAIQDISQLSECSLYGGYDYSQTDNVKFSNRNLKVNETATISFTYTVDKKTFNSSAMHFVIGTSSLKKYDNKNYREIYNKGKYEGVIFSLS